MAEPFDLLMEVQDHDTVLDQLRHRIDTLPERTELQAVTQRLASLAATSSEVRSRVDELSGSQHHLEQQIAALAKRRHEIEGRMESGQVPSRDLQAMDHEVHQLRARMAQLEEDQLVLMEEQEPLDAVLVEHAAAEAALTTEAGRLESAISQAVSALEASIAEVEAIRTAAAAGLPGELAERYELLRSRLGGIGAARLVGDHCDGCHLVLSSVEVERIRRLPPDQLATCPECDRILVR
jgi:predicted  nucleic acid-binding Zn-ribbon protein